MAKNKRLPLAGFGEDVKEWGTLIYSWWECKIVQSFRKYLAIS